MPQDLKDIEAFTRDVVNGSKPANMATNSQGGFYGTGTLNTIFKDVNDERHYIPFAKEDGVDRIYEAKEVNKKNLINIIAEATEKLGEDKDAVAKVFFSDHKMEAIRQGDKELPLALGGLSRFEEGDILLTGWGRPDPQKGLPITLEAFEKFLTDESVPLEIRKHSKLLMGAGGGNDAFRGDNAEWKLIQECIERIENIEVNGQKGYFEGNVCYVNGLFPNRIANCANVAVLTSRYEPCGITPFESYAAGMPVISIKTGGAPDFVKDGVTGFLTEDPFMLSRKALGLSEETTAIALDIARREHIAPQIAEKKKKFLSTIQTGLFAQRQKEYIKVTMDEKVEWHNNSSYNNGRCADDIYLNDKFRTQDNNVPTEIKSNLRGKFNESAFDVKPSVGGGEKPKGMSTAAKIAIGAAAVVAAGITYAVVKNKNNKEAKNDSKNLSSVA